MIFTCDVTTMKNAVPGDGRDLIKPILGKNVLKWHCPVCGRVEG